MARRADPPVDRRGRWIGVPIRARATPLGLKGPWLAWVVVLFALTVAAAGLSGIPSTAPIGAMVTIVAMLAWLGFVIFAAVVGIMAIVRRAFGRSRGPSGDDWLPLTWTDAAARIPLTERVHSPGRAREAASVLRQLLEGAIGREQAPDWLQPDLNDLPHDEHSMLGSGIERSRACAAIMRLCGCRPENVLPIVEPLIQSAEVSYGEPLPRIWFIDEAPAAPFRERRIRLDRDGRRLWPAAVGAAATAGLPARGLRLVNFAGHLLVPVAGLLGATMKPLLALAGAGLLAVWVGWRLARPRWALACGRDGAELIRGGGILPADRLAIDPGDCTVLVLLPHHHSAAGARPLPKTIWRFLLSAPPWAIEVRDFDATGSPWEDLVREFEQREEEAVESWEASPVPEPARDEREP